MRSHHIYPYCLIFYQIFKTPYSFPPPKKKLNKNSVKKSQQEFQRGVVEMNLNRIHETTVSIPSLTQWVKNLALP